MSLTDQQRDNIERWPDNVREFFEERAAVYEHEACMSRDHAEIAAYAVTREAVRLGHLRRPTDEQHERTTG